MATQQLPNPTAHRLPSFPYPTEDLFDILRAGDEDVLDFPNLEWVLDTEVPELPANGEAQAPAPMEHVATQAVAAPTIAPPPPPVYGSSQTLTPGWSAQLPHDGKLEPSSSGDDTHEVLLPSPNGTKSQPPLPMHHSNESHQLVLQAAAAAAAAAPGHAPVVARSSFTSTRPSNSSSFVEGTSQGGSPTHQAPKKKRTRNAEQMAQNRVAQQKYRERKKQEHEQLQQALDKLTAQLAALKALEAKTAMLQNENTVLSATTAQQAQRISELTVQVETQAVELAAARQEVVQATTLLNSQQLMILDQHSKLKLQEEVIESLRARLSDKMDQVFEGHDPKTVCQRMIAAVRTALAGAKNVEGLQEVLEKLPDDVVTSICKSILCEVKSMWPELAARLHSLQLCTNYRCGEKICT